MEPESTRTRRNRLAGETSPYLLQHADNPVDWYPWGPEALERARAEGKPILLSIGYSACHWCHVMAHESFEDEATAALMNELFVNVKVDREERPDLDRIYQTAHQMLTQRGGGWPLTMFLTAARPAAVLRRHLFPGRGEVRHAGLSRRACASGASTTATTRDDIRRQGDALVRVFGELLPAAGPGRRGRSTRAARDCARRARSVISTADSAASATRRSSRIR